MSAEVSDQVVRMMLMGVEVSVKIAGHATKHLIAYLLALKNGDKKVSGNTSVAKIVNQSKNIRIFSIKDEDLSKFKTLAKKYGMLYSVIRDMNLGDGKKDVMVKGEDASKLQRVFDIMGYGDVERDNEDPNISNDDKKKQASEQEPESQKSKQEKRIDDAMSPGNRFYNQPDPVNGLDGKDPNEVSPQNKTDLAEQMQGKSINTRKNLAKEYIQTKEHQPKPRSKQRTRNKTKKR